VSARGRQRSQAALGASGCAEGGARPSARRLRRAWQLDHRRGHPGGSICQPVDWGPSCFIPIVHQPSYASCFGANTKDWVDSIAGDGDLINLSKISTMLRVAWSVVTDQEREKLKASQRSRSLTHIPYTFFFFLNSRKQIREFSSVVSAKVQSDFFPSSHESSSRD